jgi:hypothetical protein
MSFSEANLKSYIEGMGMDTYTHLDDVYMSDDDPRAEDLKNCLKISLEAVPTEPHGNNIWENRETYRVDLYHAQKLSVNRVRELLQKYPAMAVTTTLLYTEGFESGSSGWALSNAARSTTKKRTGSYSMALSGSPTGGSADLTFASTLLPNRASLYVYVTALGTSLFTVDFGSGTGYVTFTVTASDGTLKFTGRTGGQVDTGKKLSIDTWYLLRLDHINYTTGVCDVYVDADCVINNATIYTDAPVTLAIGSQSAVAFTMYVDDVTMYRQPCVDLDFLEKSIRPRNPVYMNRMKNGMHHWAMTFDITKTVEVT